MNHHLVFPPPPPPLLLLTNNNAYYPNQSLVLRVAEKTGSDAEAWAVTALFLTLEMERRRIGERKLFGLSSSSNR